MLNRVNRAMITKAIDALAIQPGAVAADLGFGGGLGLRLFLDRVGPQGKVYGVDVSPTMLSSASRRFRPEIANGRLILHSGSMTQLPLSDGSITAAITNNTIYFIADLERAFSELTRILSRSGRLVVGIGDPEWMAKMPTTPYGFTIRPTAEVVELAQSAGLAIQEHLRVGDGGRVAHLLVFSRSP